MATASRLRLLIWSRFGRKGASSRLRHRQYVPYLGREGVEVTILPFLSDRYLESFYLTRRRNKALVLLAYICRLVLTLVYRFKRFDLVIVEKELFPYLPAWIERLLLAGRPYLLDFDDATFHTYDLHHSFLVRKFLGSKIDSLMRHATVVTAGSPYLQERALSAGASNIVALPTVVDLTRYPATQMTPSSEPIIGWCGTPMTTTYLQDGVAALNELARRRQFTLLVIGAPRFRSPKLQVEAVDWSEETEVRDLSRCAIGIMPLRDGPWERGKCGYKLIQFMALGIPVVASAVGANNEIVLHGKTGFLARSDQEWVEYLNELLDNPDLRKEFGTNARRRVEEQYCVQSTVKIFMEILDRAVERHERGSGRQEFNRGL